jgi:hypothetical protein
MAASMSGLAALFPDTDHRLHLTLRRGDPAAFFAVPAESGPVLAERARWIAAAPGRYARLTPEGEPLLAEFAECARGWGLPEPDSVAALGAAYDADIVLLSPDAAGEFRLRGGALCFPTGWALEEKIGCTMDFIHGPVPGLNAALGSPIRQFLARLRPGPVFLRDNWGLAATPELNLHPVRGLPVPRLPPAPERLWLRVEHQALAALPRTGGVVFGIRIALHRLDTVIAAGVGPGLRRALATMPPELIAYKRLDGIAAALAEAL